MRFDQRCELVYKENMVYDVQEGKMVGGEQSKKVVPAHIGPVRAQQQALLGDQLKEVSKVVWVRQYAGERKVDSLVIDGQPFHIVKRARHGRGMLVFYVKEAIRNAKGRD